MVNESSRERLTAAAFALFDEQGYEQTTVEDIAARPQAPAGSRATRSQNSRNVRTAST